jgi:Dynamin family
MTTLQRQLNQRTAVALRDCTTACERAGRSDLLPPIQQATAHLENATTSIVVVGEFRVGKGSVVNALIERRVCPTASGLEPHGAISISYGQQPAAQAWSADQRRTEPVAIDLAAIARGDFDTALTVEGIARIDVSVPSAILRSGIELIDTPSTAGLSSVKAIADLDAVRSADAILFVTTAAQPLTRSELTAIETFSLLSSSVTVVLNKIDLYPNWREVRAVNERALTDAGLSIRTFPVSAELLLSAAGDAAVAQESGMAKLAICVRDHIARTIEAARIAEARAGLVDVLDQVRAPVATELRALDDPSSLPEIIRDNELKLAEADALKRTAASWANALNDGFRRLIAAVEQQLKSDFSTLQLENDQALDEHAAAEIWAELQGFVIQRSSWILARSHGLMGAGLSGINDEVGRRFAGVPDGAELPRIPIYRPESGSTTIFDPGFVTSSRRAKTFVGLRGAVSGLTMFSVLSQFVFPPLVAVAPIGAIFTTRRTMKEERGRELDRHRIAARNSLRQFTTQALSAGLTETRQALEDARSVLRDHYSHRAEQLSRTLVAQAESLRESKQRAKVDRDARANELRRELGRLDALTQVVRSLGDIATSDKKVP